MEKEHRATFIALDENEKVMGFINCARRKPCCLLQPFQNPSGAIELLIVDNNNDHKTDVADALISRACDHLNQGDLTYVEVNDVDEELKKAYEDNGFEEENFTPFFLIHEKMIKELKKKKTK